MNAGTIAALATAIPAILAAIAALVTAFKSNAKSEVTKQALINHIVPDSPPPTVASTVVPPQSEGDAYQQ